MIIYLWKIFVLQFYISAQEAHNILKKGKITFHNILSISSGTTSFFFCLITISNVQSCIWMKKKKRNKPSCSHFSTTSFDFISFLDLELSSSLYHINPYIYTFISLLLFFLTLHFIYLNKYSAFLKK